MKKIALISSLLLFTLCIHAQSKTGFIDHDSVIKALPEYKAETERIDKIRMKLEDSLQKIGDGLNKIYTEYTNNAGARDSVADAQKEEELMQLKMKMDRTQQEMEAYYQSEIDISQNRIDSSLKKHVEAFSKKNKLACLSNKPGILYCEKCADYTSLLIDYIKKQK